MSPPLMTRRALFLGWMQIGLTGFGGVLAVARRVLVEDRGWLTGPEFTELLSIGQVLPGPNVINVSIAVGDRYHGPVGSLISFVGLMLAPIAIVLTLGSLYVRFGEIPVTQGIVRGLAPAAAGLMVATGLKMAFAEIRRPWKVLIVLIGFILIGLMRWPLFQVLPVLAAIGIGLSWWTLRGAAKR
ncbi:MAG: chromate transporter [Burkholderiales bacterium]